MTVTLEPTQEALWRTLHSVSEWVKFADAKAAATLAIDGAILALLSSRFQQTPHLLSWSAATVYTALLAAGLSALLAIWTVLPRIRRFGDSLVHYGTIAAYPSGDHYRAAAISTLSDPDVFNEALARHVWTVSRVATRKYALVTRSIECLAVALVVGVLALV